MSSLAYDYESLDVNLFQSNLTSFPSHEEIKLAVFNLGLFKNTWPTWISHCFFTNHVRMP